MELTNAIFALDILVFAAAIAMAFQAFKAHRVMQTQVSLAFSACFWLISAGLFLHMLADAPATLLSVSAPLVLAGSLFLLSGYTLLLLVVEKVTSKAMWLLTFLLVVSAVVLANNVWGVTNLLAVVLLALLANRFYANFLRNNSRSSLIIYIAFILLVGAHIAAFLSLFNLSAQIVYLLVSIVAYFALFAVSWRVTR